MPLRLPLALALTVLGACAGARPAGEVVAVGDLPAAHREVLEAYGRGGQAWEAKRAEVLADPELARFLVDNLVVELVRAHEATGGHDAARALAARSRARAELVRLEEVATPVLVELYERSDAVVASLVAETLVDIGRPAAVAAASLLDEPDPGTRRRAAVLFQSLPHAGRAEERIRAGLLELTEDPVWFVRAEAGLCLGLRGARDRETAPARKRLGQLLFDADPSVAEYAARGLGALGDPQAVPALIAGLRRARGEGEVRLVQACGAALESLTGAHSGDLAGWEAWWRDHAGAGK
ncbi:MAG TPA: HEAT repeat domain-containing protein [Myxococcota bacterium]|nr:HEAT repeat domain-containing protein [Myxococcota bacterium]